jgi:hypothetical protein
MTEEERFKSNIDYIGEIVSNIVSDNADKLGDNLNSRQIDLAIEFLGAFDMSNVIETFIQRSYPHWDMINDKNRKFFVDHADNIFSGVPSDGIKSFKKIFTTDGAKIDEDMMDMLFNSFLALCKISIKYIFRNRKPRNIGGNISYTEDYMPEVEIESWINRWNLKIESLISR